MGGEKATFDRAIAYFDKADGRDKLFKTLQNWSKVLAWRFQVLALTAPNADRPAARLAAAKWKKFASSLSEFRALGKFFKWLKNVKEVQDILADPQSLSLGDCIDGVSNVCDFFYKLFDNVEYLSKYKLITSDAAQWEERSKMFQFWAYVTAVIVDFILLSKAGEPTEAEKNMSGPEMLKSMEKRQFKLQMDFAKDFADLLRVAAGRGHLSSVLPATITPAFAGVMGTVSGGVGAYQVWLKTK